MTNVLKVEVEINIGI